jgi:hypothetical protein
VSAFKFKMYDVLVWLSGFSGHMLRGYAITS